VSAPPAPLNVLVLDDAEAVGALTAELVANRLRAFDDLHLVLPAGRTPAPMYAALRRIAAEGRLDAAGATLIQLDELWGVGAADPRSFAAYLRREAGGLGFSSMRLIDGGARNRGDELVRHRRAIAEAPLGLCVLGIGQNGHVAFNEPGTAPYAPTRLALLEPESRAALEGFAGTAPDQALTIGLQEIAAAREILIIATGTEKAEALSRLAAAVPDRAWPASLLAAHPRLSVICDRAAAAKLPRPAAGRVLVVLGHHHQGKTGLSGEGRARLRAAERSASRSTPGLVIFSGWTSDGIASEASYLAGEWAGPAGVPLLLEEAARSTAENTAYTALFVEAAGRFSELEVLSSRSHLRARYFFAALRKRGLAVRFRGADYGLARGLFNELRWVATMRSARRRAMKVLGPPRRESSAKPRRGR
jgi:glucosamine-6-phosphate deaminase